MRIKAILLCGVLVTACVGADQVLLPSGSGGGSTAGGWTNLVNSAFGLQGAQTWTLTWPSGYNVIEITFSLWVGGGALASGSIALGNEANALGQYYWTSTDSGAYTEIITNSFAIGNFVPINHNTLSAFTVKAEIIGTNWLFDLTSRIASNGSTSWMVFRESHGLWSPSNGSMVFTSAVITSGGSGITNANLIIRGRIQ
jgi:hypothetical protein